MRVLYIGMYSEDGRKGLESSSLAKRKDAAASIAKAAVGELLHLMYLQGNYDMAAIMELPMMEILKHVTTTQPTHLLIASSFIGSVQWSKIGDEEWLTC